MNIPKPPIDDEIVTLSTREVRPYLAPEVVESIVLNGDLSKLSPKDKIAYYLHRCQILGLDPATKPFDLLKLNGKEVLYANKTCAAQLRANYKISTAIVGEIEWNGLYIVRVRAWYPDNRQHEDEGFASLNGLAGDNLGNARLKAMTKATRRAILHLCGLGEMDESEVETIPMAQRSAIQEAKTVLVTQTMNGTDVIEIADIKGADAEADTIEVLDTQNRVWQFAGKSAHELAFEAQKLNKPLMISWEESNGKRVVRTGRL